jgi:xanthine/CO dehydrogenase XdhC/CoxF family maturation factor
VQGRYDTSADSAVHKAGPTASKKKPAIAAGLCCVGETYIRLQVLVEPADDRVVPQHRVGRLEHPVVFVREHQQLALDAAPLQGGEGRQACAVGMRKSRSPWTTSIGVFHLFTWSTGLKRSCCSGTAKYGPPFSQSVNHCSSVE